MIDAGSQASLAQESLAHLRRIQLYGEHLQGDAAPAGEMLGLVDGTHPAGAEQSDQPVPVEVTREI
jgi:hypothetical protein